MKIKPWMVGVAIAVWFWYKAKGPTPHYSDNLGHGCPDGERPINDAGLCGK